MSADSKRDLTEKVVDLTIMNRFRATATSNGKPDPEMAEKLRLRMREEQIVLHLKHFESEQLSALLEFYGTEVGASILKSQEQIASEIQAGFRLVSGEFSDEALIQSDDT